MLNIGDLIFQILLRQIKAQFPGFDISRVEFENFKTQVALVIRVFFFDFGGNTANAFFADIRYSFKSSFIILYLFRKLDRYTFSSPESSILSSIKA